MGMESLGSIQTTSEFLDTPEGKSLFGTENALNWFERVNRAALIKAGVLIKLRGSWHRIRPAYDQVVIEIARLNTKLSNEEGNKNV